MCNATVTSSCIIGALNLRKRRCRLRSCKRAWLPVLRLAWLKSSGQALSINSWPLSTYNLTLRQLPAGSSWVHATFRHWIDQRRCRCRCLASGFVFAVGGHAFLLPKNPSLVWDSCSADRRDLPQLVNNLCPV
ncbi:hypothetical protein T02_14679 [Trichinella nativa]|uniref:Uncharacterized protein n=1 Tax=Trichinella nativa TaxID=6335 RepID=A0A0V1LIX9_9BILA|nr:hypothetical protein T02_14679 [Trichinella nativa]